MARFFSVLFWTAAFLVILLAIDQLLVRVPASQPAHVAIATFYRELRSRLLDLTTAQPKGASTPPTPAAKPAAPVQPNTPPPPPDSIEAVIEQRQAKGTAPPAPAKAPTGRPASPEATARYLFVDEQGNLHFAGTLAEIPEQYRAKATRMEE